MLPPLIVPDDPALVHRLGDLLRTAGYEAQNLLRYLGTVEIPSPDAPSRARLLYRTRGGSPLDTLVRLLLVGEPVETTALRSALAPLDLGQFASMGWFRIAGDRAEPTVVVFPYSGMLFVCDAPPERRASEDPGVAVGVTESSIILQLLTIRRKVGRVLDLGCGCGIQSLLAAEHADQVTGIDRVERCVAAATLSGLLNRNHRVSFVQGDAFEPVRGQRFDLIVANLPFVIATSFRYHYSDSGHELDEFPRRIAAEAPALLEEGGFCEFLCEWIHPYGQDWRERLRQWFKDSGCDVWVIPVETRSAASYTEELMPLRPPEGDALRQYTEWLAYYERHNVESITTGAVIMRRRTAAANWIKIDETPEWSRSAASDDLLAAFTARDFVEARSDGELTATRFQVNPNARMVQRLRRENSSWVTDTAEIRFDSGFTYVGKVDRWIVALLASTDGEKALGELTARIATQAGYPPDKFTAAFVPVVRHLIERGFLLPADAS